MRRVSAASDAVRRLFEIAALVDRLALDHGTHRQDARVTSALSWVPSGACASPP